MNLPNAREKGALLLKKQEDLNTYMMEFFFG